MAWMLGRFNGLIRWVYDVTCTVCTCMHALILPKFIHVFVGFSYYNILLTSFSCDKGANSGVCEEEYVESCLSYLGVSAGLSCVFCTIASCFKVLPPCLYLYNMFLGKRF